MADVDDLDDEMYDDKAEPASNEHVAQGSWQQQDWGYGYGGYPPVQQVHSNWQQLHAQQKKSDGDDTGIADMLDSLKAP